MTTGTRPGLRLGVGSAIICTLAVIGCQGGGTASSAPSSPPASASAAVASPSSTPTASTAEASSGAPVVAALCAEGMAEPCGIAPGTYSTAPFEEAFTFTIVSTWQNDRAWPHGGEIFLADGAIQWASGVKVGVVDGIDEAIGPTPADLIAHLRKTEGFTVGEVSPVTVGDEAGQQVDVLTNDTEVHGIIRIEEDDLNLAPGEKIRFLVIDKGGQTVILTIDAFKADQFEAFEAVAQPVIDSIVWLP